MQSDPHITTGRCHVNSQNSLSVHVEDAAQNIKVPFTTIEAIWKKAETLVTSKNSVVPAPGFGEDEKMVKSHSGSAPHLVTIDQNTWQYKCDDKCLQYKSVSVCSHTVAAAEINGHLTKFIDFLRRHNCSPNLTQLAQHGMPAGAGRKGGKPAKKKQPRKKAPSEENRIPLSTNTNSSCSIQSQPPPDPSYSPYPPYYPYHAYSSYHQYPPYQQSSSWTMPMTPLPYSPNMPATTTPIESFKVHLKTGNISVCSGCRSSFSKQDVIVLQHSEHRNYTSPQGHPSSKFGNAYYHIKRKCVENKWGPNFTILTPENLELTSPQRDILYEEFGV